MKGTTMSTQKRDWKVLLKRAEDLSSKGRGATFDLMKACLALAESPDFENGVGGVAKARKKIVQLLGHLAIGAEEIKGLLLEYPRKEQWTKGDVQTMLQTYRAKNKPKPRKRPSAAKPVISEDKQLEIRKRFNKGETHEALAKAFNLTAEGVRAVCRNRHREKSALETENHELKERNEELQIRNGVLSEEVATLRNQLHKAEILIADLQRDNEVLTRRFEAMKMV